MAWARGSLPRMGWASVGAVESLGEKLGSQALLYNPLVFTWYHRVALANAPAVVQTFELIFPRAHRCIDIGAGTGTYAAALRHRGFEAVACERSRVGRLYARRQGVPCVPFDLSREPPAQVAEGFDLAYCFEVAEHVPPESAARLVGFVATQAPVAVFTAAPPGQGGTGHVHERPKGYWITQFARAGMRYRPDVSEAVSSAFARHGATAPWLIANVMVFER